MTTTSRKYTETPAENTSRVPVEQAGTIAVFTLLSRLLGLVRDIVIIAALGVGADIFFMAFRVPNIMRRMTAEGVLGMAHTANLATLSPPNLKTLARQSEKLGQPEQLGKSEPQNTALSFPFDEARMQRTLRYSFGVSLKYGAITALAACVLWFFAPFCMAIVAPGFTESRLQEAVFLFRHCLAYLPLASMSAIMAASLMYYGMAGCAAFAPLLLNMAILLVGVGAFVTGEAVYFSLGVVVGGCLQVAWLFFCLYRIVPKDKRALVYALPAHATPVYAPVVYDESHQKTGKVTTRHEDDSGEGRALSAPCSSWLHSLRGHYPFRLFGWLRRKSRCTGEGVRCDAQGAQGCEKATVAESGESGKNKDREKSRESGGNISRNNKPGGEWLTSCGEKLPSFIQVCLGVTAGSSAYLYFFMTSVGASFFPEGAVSAMYIGERFIEFPLALIGSSIGMACMPQFSNMISDEEALGKALMKTLRLVSFVAFPAVMGIVMLNTVIIELFLGHGVMRTAEIRITANIFAIMGCSLPAFCLSRQFIGTVVALAGADATGGRKQQQRALLTRMGHSVWVGCLTILLVALVLGVWLGLGLEAVAWGLVLVAWGQCYYLWRLVYTILPPVRSRGNLGRHIPFVLALLSLVGILWGVSNVLESLPHGWLTGVALGFVVVVTAVGWIKVFTLWGNEEAIALWGMIRAVWRKGTSR